MLDLSNLRRPDHRRCQNYVSAAYYYHFRDDSLQVRDLRCKTIPTYLLTQRSPDSTGHRGQMALCARCLRVALHDLGPDFGDVTELSIDLQTRAEARAARLARGLTKRQLKLEGTPS